MPNEVKVDVAIFGGGIAGLWLLDILLQKGYNTILLEKNALGTGQTICSQGIIHGGTKYTLAGKLTSASQTIQDMPNIWRSCLRGEGPINLQQTKVLSSNHYMWTSNSFSSKLATFMASKVMQTRVAKLNHADYPSFFQQEGFSGSVYKLDEVVLDIASLLQNFLHLHQHRIWKVDNYEIVQSEKNVSKVKIYQQQESLEVYSQRYIFTSGVGNENICNQWKNVATQRRPLHMVLVRGEGLLPLYAHCLGADVVPRLTITTHPGEKNVWYVGGQIAERGNGKAAQEQIKMAQKELSSLFPWLSQEKLEWQTFSVDRAEPKQIAGLRPDNAVFHEQGNIIVGWPTKLALAPQLAEEVSNYLQKNLIQQETTKELPSWPCPNVAKLPWQENTTWIKDL